MKSSKVMAALVTMGLAAAVATPAMALENQFSGAFTSFYDLSNYSASGTLAKDAATQNYFVQRVRLGYTAKASEDVKLVTKFELDYNWYGNSSYANARGGGGALGADTVNLETKNIYLDLNVAKSLNAKIGMQPYNDSFKGIIFDADMAGLLLSHEYTNASVAAGFFRFHDRTNTATWADINTIGKYTSDMFSLDGKYSVNKETKLGAAYYYMSDNRVSTPADKDIRVHTLGINGETAVGPLSLTGFVLTQFGKVANDKTAKGMALNLGAKMPLGAGTARAEFLYASGGKDGKSLYIPASDNGGTEGGGFYDNEMIMLSRDKNATTIDNAIVYDVNNANQGVIFGSVGYDHTFTPKLSGSANLGLGFAAKTDKTVTNNKSDFLGTEINCETNYKLMPAVTVGARAGYVILGDYFKANTGSRPTLDNPYDV